MIGKNDRENCRPKFWRGVVVSVVAAAIVVGIIVVIHPTLGFFKNTFNYRFFLIICVLVFSYGASNTEENICNFIKNIFTSNLNVLFMTLALLGILIIHNLVDNSTINDQNNNVYLTFLGGIALVFSYFYNKYEEKRIKVHSEANWRGRLFDLANKSNKTYNDILYFMTFFNNNPSCKNNKDYKLLEAIKVIVTYENDKGNNNLLDNVQNILLGSENKKVGSENKKTILTELADNLKAPVAESGYVLIDTDDKNKDTSKELDGNQIVAFNLCINYLLKKDWEEQMKN